jgi:hypothetical protein
MRYLTSPAVWGLLAGLTSSAGYIPYLRDAWRRTSDPDPVAWLIWTIEYGVLVAAQAAQHPPWPALCLSGLQLLGTAAVLAVLAARGGWRFSPGRCVLIGVTVVIMSVCWFEHAPGTAMCLALGAETGAMALVMFRAYNRPASETLLTWYAFALGGLLDLPALGGHAPGLLYVYPVYFFVMGAGVVVATTLGARVLRAAPLRYLREDPERPWPYLQTARPAPRPERYRERDQRARQTGIRAR